MKFLRQIFWIILFSFLGEILRFLIPAPIPASIYGMVLLFGALQTGLLPLDRVRETGSFLASLLPVLFIAPTVNLLSSWDAIRDHLVALGVILLVTTVLTFAAAGLLTAWACRKGGRHG